MNRRILDIICDPHISILQNIWLLKNNCSRCRDIDRVKLYIHPATYDRLIVEIEKDTSFCKNHLFWERGKSNYGTIYGLPIDVDNRIKPYHLVIGEEENMRIGQNTFTPIGDHSIDAMAYAMNDIRTTTSCLKHINNKLPKKYIINDGATILFWEDGTKTIVKRAEDDSFDPVKGFLWAYFQKQSGLSKTKANKYLREIDNQNTITINIDTPLSAISHALDNIFNIKKD